MPRYVLAPPNCDVGTRQPVLPSQVFDVNRLPGPDQPLHGGAGGRRSRPALGQEAAQLFRNPAQRKRRDGAVVDLEQDAKLRAANAGGVVQHGIEDRLQLAGRARYGAQHLVGRSLPFQRLVQLACAAIELLLEGGCGGGARPNDGSGPWLGVLADTLLRPGTFGPGTFVGPGAPLGRRTPAWCALPHQSSLTAMDTPDVSQIVAPAPWCADQVIA